MDSNVKVSQQLSSPVLCNQWNAKYYSFQLLPLEHGCVQLVINIAHFHVIAIWRDGYRIVFICFHLSKIPIKPSKSLSIACICAEAGCFWRKNNSQFPVDFANGWLERENLLCTPHSKIPIVDSISSTAKCELPAIPSNEPITWECGDESCHLGCSEGFFKNRQIKISYWFKTVHFILRIFSGPPGSFHRWSIWSR